MFGNRILNRLTDEHCRRLAPRPRALEAGETAFRVLGRPTHVYFPQSGCLSIKMSDLSGKALSAGVVSREGAAGLSEALGRSVVRTRYVAMVGGHGWSVDVNLLRELAREDPLFLQTMFSQLDAQLAEARQEIACQAFHAVPSKLARWLLEFSDAAEGGVVHLDQEALAELVGVQRATVNGYAQAIRAAGLIAYRRGRIWVVDRAGLQARACECLRIRLETTEEAVTTPGVSHRGERIEMIAPA